VSKSIQQWKQNQITLQPDQVYEYNAQSESTNIFQIINRIASGGGVVLVDIEPNVSADRYMLRVDQGSNQNLVLPYEAKRIFLKTDSTSPLVVTIVEISSDDILFTFGAAQLVNISGNVQIQEPISVAGTVSVSGEVEIKNDTGNPIPISGSVEVTGIPEVEIKNDSGNPLPVSGNVGITGTPTVSVSGEVEIKNDTGNPLYVNKQIKAAAPANYSGTLAAAATAQQAVPANAARQFLLVQNLSAADLWIQFNVAAVMDQPSIKLAAGEKISFSDYLPTAFLSIIGGTLGQAFTIWEG
jgi:hypothetical protein